ncbi:hypothetical protein [Zhongshania sp.]|uniref:hypothetical protein n=1 Tax=Zhongshania sp. TaxID=1971902 RepID=UPI003563B2B2
MTHAKREDVLDVQVKVLFTQAQIPALDYMAARAGKQRGTFIRDLVLSQIELSLNPPTESKYVQ